VNKGGGLCGFQGVAMLERLGGLASRLGLGGRNVKRRGTKWPVTGVL